MNPMLKLMKSRTTDFQRQQRAFHPGAKSWYSINAKDESGAVDVFIFDAIGFFGVDAQEFIQELDDITATTINLRINSPGGNVFDGIAIYTAVLAHPAKVHARIEGVAASMASIIALAGDTVEMAEGAFYMIHKPWSVMVGSADEMRKEAGLLDKIEQNAINIYEQRSSLSADELRTALAEETWYTAEEAKQAGFIDSIFKGSDSQAGFDLSVFSHLPEGLEGKQPQRGRPELSGTKEIESALRDAGLSRAQAKAVLANGVNSIGLRDADDPDTANDVIALLEQGISILNTNTRD